MDQMITVSRELLLKIEESLESRCGTNAPERREILPQLRELLEQPAVEPTCNPHPKAPHGFDRNASHSAHRYVCDCESWEPYDAGYNDGFQAGMKSEQALCDLSDQTQEMKAQQPQLLTDDEIRELARQQSNSRWVDVSIEFCNRYARAVEQAVHRKMGVIT